MRTAFHKTKLDSEPPDRKSFSSSLMHEGIMNRGFRRIRTLGANLLVGTAIFCSSVGSLSVYANPPDPKTNVVYEKRKHATSIFGIPSPLDVQEGKSAEDIYKDKGWLRDKFVTTAEESFMGADKPRIATLGDLDAHLRELENYLWTPDKTKNAMTQGKYANSFDYNRIYTFINKAIGLVGIVIYEINEELNGALFFNQHSVINQGAEKFYSGLNEIEIGRRKLLTKTEVEGIVKASTEDFRPFLEGLKANKIGFRKLMTKGAGKAAGTATKEVLEAAGAVLIPLDIASIFELDRWIQHYKSMCYPDDANLVIYYAKGFRLDNLDSAIKGQINSLISFINGLMKILDNKDIEINKKNIETMLYITNGLIELAKAGISFGIDILKSIPNIKLDAKDAPELKNSPIINGLVLGYDKPFFIVLPATDKYGFEPSIAKVHGKIVFEGKSPPLYAVELRHKSDNLDPILADINSLEFSFIAGTCPNDDPKYSLAVWGSKGFFKPEEDIPLLESKEFELKKGGDYTVSLTVKDGCKTYKTEISGGKITVSCDTGTVKPSDTNRISLGNFICKRDSVEVPASISPLFKPIFAKVIQRIEPNDTPMPLCNVRTEGHSNGIDEKIVKMANGTYIIVINGIKEDNIEAHIDALINGTAMNLSHTIKFMDPKLKRIGAYGIPIKFLFKCSYTGPCK